MDGFRDEPPVQFSANQQQSQCPFSWLGLPATRNTLPLFEAAWAIPAFARRPFRLALRKAGASQTWNAPSAWWVDSLPACHLRLHVGGRTAFLFPGGA